ncbi:MAG: AAA family ATPase [Bacteroidales bacterium]|nr:AAA family ATPase [Bacteroidales bacterium]
MKKLPIGIQSFEKLRSKDCLYVDKTKIIHKLILSGDIYFLSRPRRFGKSLLISTMEALFKGQKELFEGLYVDDKWDWSQQYPVIRIDWTLIDHSTPEKMGINMIGYLEEIARNFQITLTSESAPDCFRKLIRTLHAQTGKRVVVLIDEYDKPITSHLFDDQLSSIRTAVHDFYQVMSGADEYLRFVFMTGVSKFSGLSVFSALNNLKDITLDRKYASICGYTQEELESNFSEHIDSAAEYLKMTGAEVMGGIRYWYNGYTWDGETAIYNPFSTLNFFDMQEFADYWFRTGTPTFLIDIIQRRNSTDNILEPIVVEDSVFKGYNPPDIDELPLLFQTGYLTVKHKELIDGIPRYTLGIPNSEVNKAFLTCLLEAYGKYRDYQIDGLRITMERQIEHTAQRSHVTDTRSALLQQISRKDNSSRHSFFRERCRLQNGRVKN